MMEAKQSETWEGIVTAGERVAHAYQQMLRAVDALADTLEYNEDHVLRQVLPRAVKERRDCERVLVWLNENRDEIEAHLQVRQAARDAAVRREALLAKLNLTADEVELLGIGEAES